MGHISDADDIFTEPKKLSVFLILLARIQHKIMIEGWVIKFLVNVVEFELGVTATNHGEVMKKLNTGTS
jgi:hypothetical protein